jgi:hypothetical protein
MVLRSVNVLGLEPRLGTRIGSRGIDWSST